jgi:SAM-dependent methyltransferase
MQQPPIDQSQIDARISGHEQELLRLWQAEQGGAAKDRDLQIAASCIPFPRDRALRTIDLGCGPGDMGRAIWQNYPNAQIDFVDRDPLLLSICRGFNGLAGVPGTCRQLDLDDESWSQDLQARHYDVIAAASALHWLSATRAAAVLGDIHRLLDDSGILLFAEPAIPQAPFAVGFEKWKARQSPRYEQRNWKAFWHRANSLAGYDHTGLLGSREGSRIGDRTTVRGWIALAEASGFQTIDVLWKDADGVIIAAQKAQAADLSEGTKCRRVSGHPQATSP